jgi:hypothetical protein
MHSKGGNLGFAVPIRNYHSVFCSDVHLIFILLYHASEGGNNVGAHHCCCCRCCVAAVGVSLLPLPTVAIIAIRSLHRFIQEASEMFPCFVLIVSPAIANNSRGEYG